MLITPQLIALPLRRACGAQEAFPLATDFVRAIQVWMRFRAGGIRSIECTVLYRNFAANFWTRAAATEATTVSMHILRLNWSNQR